MSQKEKVIHKQTFQNSKEVVELIWLSKPKPTYPSKIKKNTFVRDCPLKEELHKIDAKKKDKENIPRKSILQKDKRSRHDKRQRPIGTNAQKNHVLPPNTSYAELFQSLSNGGEGESSAGLDTSFLRKYVEDNLERDDHRKPNRRRQIIHQTPTKSSHVRNPMTILGNTDENKKSCASDDQEPKHADVSVQCGSYMIQENSPAVNYIERRAPSTENANQQMKDGGITDEQTHSPFGESALLQLKRIREKLRSRGDSEGSEALDMLEEFIEAHGSGPRNQNAPSSIAKSALCLLSTPNSVFHPPISNPQQGCKTNCVNKRKVLELSQQLAEQHTKIDYLKHLSAELLNQHEQLKKEIEEDKSELPLEVNRHCQDGNALPASSQSPDLGAQENHIEKEAIVGEHPQVILNMALISENEALLKKVKHYGDMIVKLEFKLKEQETPRELMRTNQLVSQREDRAQHLPSRTPNIHVEAAPNSVGFSNQCLPPYDIAPPLNIQGHQKSCERGIPQPCVNTSTSAFHSKPESEVDSAFDEKTFSRSTSKTSSPFCHQAPKQDALKKAHVQRHCANIHAELENYTGPSAVLGKRVQHCNLSSHYSDSPWDFNQFSISRSSEAEYVSKSDDEAYRRTSSSHLSKRVSSSALDVRQSSNTFGYADSTVLYPSKYLESTPVNAATSDQKANVSHRSGCSIEESSFISLQPEETFT